MITVGRFVYFAMDAEALGEISRGNGYAVGDLVAGQVVRVEGDDVVNLKLNIDGPDMLWVQGVPEGTEPGTWRWMYQGQEQNTTNQRPPADTTTPPGPNPPELAGSGLSE